MKPSERLDNVRLSILIPVLNEIENLPGAIEKARKWTAEVPCLEVIFIDSGSSDGSRDRIGELEGQRISGALDSSLQPSVGHAICCGANRAHGELLMVLPIDVGIDLRHLKRAASLSRDYGFFAKGYLEGRMSVYSWIQNWIRGRLMKNFVWTNAPFFRRELMSLLMPDGFLEDLDFSDALKNHRGEYFSLRVVVDDRKYLRDGQLRRILGNLLILLFYRLGYQNKNRLKEFYANTRHVRSNSIQPRTAD